eukprot:CAMPEP_0167762442 /NCGR_PEP_ID=MMETSP0110_2-20121227/12769_1 /TAXON_ID=629695 /ORGANISM="Gymnochlora sp., Strain CCMP2014" /LENGTH=586 /DNA_ID=CAMNT_0007649315 /DNA_START=55 /DNA_END=1815 /DNA_ORIENTATION=-
MEQPTEKKYRYTVGTSVKCHTGRGWQLGVIVRIDYKEPGWSKVVPYQVRLNSGPLIYVPADTPELCIRASAIETPDGIKSALLDFFHEDVDTAKVTIAGIQKALNDLGWEEDEGDSKKAVESLKKLPVKAWSLFTMKSMLEMEKDLCGASAASAGRAMVLLERSELKDKDRLLAHNLGLRAYSLIDFMAPKAASVDASKATELDKSNELYKGIKAYADDLAAFVSRRSKERKAYEDSKVPVTVLTGFLGSGKTTLLNYILKEQKEKKYAVIENEFGAVGVDDQLIRNKFDSDEDIIEMNNGCICCTVRGDLIKTLKKINFMIAKGKKFDGVIIETTGMADPAPVAQTFFADDDVAGTFKIDGIITVVDCKWIIERLDEEKKGENEAVEQVAFADVILLNKTDLVDKARVDKVKARILDINSQAKMIETKYSRVDLNKITNIGGFSLDRVLASDEEFFNFDQEHEHDSSVSSVGVVLKGELEMTKFNRFIGKMMREKGVDLYRSKGVVAIQGMNKRFVFQAVHMLFGGEPTTAWKKGEKRVSRMIFIGKNLDEKEIKEDAEACLAKSTAALQVDEKFIFGSGSGYKA